VHWPGPAIAKYLAAPAPAAKGRDQASKLDPFNAVIDELLQRDPQANAPVVQRLQPLGYDGGSTNRQRLSTRRSSEHFGTLIYNGATRRALHVNFGSTI
jgi:hypothetical protein